MAEKIRDYAKLAQDIIELAGGEDNISSVTHCATRLLNELTAQEGTNYGLMAAAVALVVIPVIIVYICLQKQIIKGMTAGAVKG